MLMTDFRRSGPSSKLLLLKKGIAKNGVNLIVGMCETIFIVMLGLKCR